MLSVEYLFILTSKSFILAFTSKNERSRSSFTELYIIDIGANLLSFAMMPASVMFLFMAKSNGLIVIQHTIAVCFAFCNFLCIGVGIYRAVNPGLFPFINTNGLHRSVNMCIYVSA